MNGDTQNSVCVWGGGLKLIIPSPTFTTQRDLYRVMCYPTGLFLSYFKSCGSIYPSET